jgi:molybdopterin/thiamine biosynthesis adenylyltransferase
MAVSETLAQAVRGAAEPLTTPGEVHWDVISPVRVMELARQFEVPRWTVEAEALEAEIVPLRYMRNLSAFAMRGQIALLRSAVAVIGRGRAVDRCLHTVATSGVGRIRVLAPSFAAPGDAEATAAGVHNANASVEVETGALDLRRGDPAAALRDVEVVAACLEDAQEEMLLQTVCRRLRLPVILAGVDGSRGQTTTVLPGDVGVPLIYRPEHLHLEKARPGSTASPHQGSLMVGAWMADQILALLLGVGEVFQNKLLFADMSTGVMETFPLGTAG